MKLIREIESKKLRLFDVETDPAERMDLAARMPERAQALNRELDTLLAAYPDARPESAKRAKLTPEQIELLRSLGYLQ
jgi:hypothetical protein